MSRWAALLALLAACESARATPEPAPAAPPSTASATDAPAPAAAGLNGIWVLGGALRPQVWLLSDRELATIDTAGIRRTYEVRPIAACQLELTSHATGARSWVSVGNVDGVLYAGPGTISVPGDDSTVCSDTGVYRMTPAGCTLTTRAQRADGVGDVLPVRCGLDLDGAAFHADDSDHERGAGGPITAYRHHGVLMSTPMALSRGERMTSEAQAVERARALADTPGRGTMPRPFPVPFDDWSMPSANPRFRPKQQVWAAAMNRRDEWQIGSYFFGGLGGERSVGLDSVWPSMAPAAFVYRSRPSPIHPAAAPVMIAEREGVTYGRFARTDWDHLVVQVLIGDGGLTPRARDRSASFEVVRIIEPGVWDLGAPAAIREDTEWRPARVARIDGDQVYLIERQRLVRRPRAAVRLVEIDTVHPPGTEVLAVPVATIEPPAFVPGRIADVIGDGLAYVVVMETGAEQTVPFDRVMLREPGQAPVAVQPPDGWTSPAE